MLHVWNNSRKTAENTVKVRKKQNLDIEEFYVPELYNCTMYCIKHYQLVYENSLTMVKCVFNICKSFSLFDSE